MNIHVTITPALDDRIANFRKLADSGIYESIARYGARVDDVVLAALQSNAPVRTGHFRDSIRSVQHGGEGVLTYEYRADDPLAHFIIEGTAAHTIQARNGGVLHFITADGAEIFARSVNHPGTQPNDFPGRAWEQVRSEVEDLLRETGRDIVSQVL